MRVVESCLAGLRFSHGREHRFNTTLFAGFVCRFPHPLTSRGERKLKAGQPKHGRLISQSELGADRVLVLTGSLPSKETVAIRDLQLQSFVAAKFTFAAAGATQLFAAANVHFTATSFLLQLQNNNNNNNKQKRESILQRQSQLLQGQSGHSFFAAAKLMANFQPHNRQVTSEPQVRSFAAANICRCRSERQFRRCKVDLVATKLHPVFAAVKVTLSLQNVHLQLQSVFLLLHLQTAQRTFTTANLC